MKRGTAGLVQTSSSTNVVLLMSYFCKINLWLTIKSTCQVDLSISDHKPESQSGQNIDFSLTSSFSFNIMKIWKKGRRKKQKEEVYKEYCINWYCSYVHFLQMGLYMLQYKYQNSVILRLLFWQNSQISGLGLPLFRFEACDILRRVVARPFAQPPS